MRKNVFEKFGLMFVFAAVLVMMFGTVSVMAENVKFETFITSVKAGEFVLSEEDNDEFVDAVKDGNTEKAMEIYKDYFDIDDVEVKATDEDTDKTETPEEVTAETEVSEETEAAEQPAALQTASETANDDAVVEDTPVAEETPAVEETPSVEETPPVEETPVVEKTPVVEPAPAQMAEQTNTSSLSDAEYLALCKIVQAEAPNEGLVGKMMVANVVLNRVASPSYPNTISGVVSQRGQFTPFRNGSFARAVPTAETIMAVDRALAGENNAVGCHSFKSTRSSNSWGHKTLAFVYGHHMFYY